MMMPVSQPEENSSGITATAEYPGQSSLRHGSPGSADKAVSLRTPSPGPLGTLLAPAAPWDPTFRRSQFLRISEPES